MTKNVFDTLASRGLARVVQFDRARPMVSPAYFPAVSGARLGSRPIDLIRLIVDSGSPRVLVSAHDIAGMDLRQRNWVSRGVRRYRARGNLVFLDCGVFESYWLRDARWDFAAYSKVVHYIEKDFYAAFDGAVHQPTARASALGFSADHLTRSLSLESESQCALIVHGLNPDRLLKAVVAVVNHVVPGTRKGGSSSVLMVAVPERECGNNVVERARTIAAIRRQLNRSRITALVHILGCGFPVSIAAYANAGADTFDSTDWSEAAIDWRSLNMTDFALLGTTGCPCMVCAKFKADNLQRGLLHNLLFYQTFCRELQRMIRERTLGDFLLEHLGSVAYRRYLAALSKAKTGGGG